MVGAGDWLFPAFNCAFTYVVLLGTTSVAVQSVAGVICFVVDGGLGADAFGSGAMGVDTLGDGTAIGVAGSGAMGVSTLGGGTGVGVAGFGEKCGDEGVGVRDGLFWLRMVRRRARAVGGGVDRGCSLGAGDVVGWPVRKRCVRDLGTLGGTTGVVTMPKMAARSLIAAICSVPRVGNGEAGAGLLRAAMSSCAAAVAASAEEVAGILASWGKNSTEREMRSAFVLGI